MTELRHLLENRDMMNEIRNNVWQQRHLFTFDHHVDELVDFFEKVIAKKVQKNEDEKSVAVSMFA
jgi:hypothetical protein